MPVKINIHNYYIHIIVPALLHVRCALFGIQQESNCLEYPEIQNLDIHYAVHTQQLYYYNILTMSISMFWVIWVPNVIVRIVNSCATVDPIILKFGFYK